MLSGVDISNLQGSPDVYRQQAWYQNAQFVIAQAIPRPQPNGLVADQLRTAKSDGKFNGLYTWLWHDPSWRLDPDVAQDQRLRLATVPDDVPLDMRPWLDEEDNLSSGWQLVSVQQRKDDVLRALDELDAFAARRSLPEAGVYWSDYYINLLFGGDIAFVDGRKQWKAHYGRPPGSLIGGPVVAHQFASIPIDSDLLLESEIINPAPEVVVQIPQAYVDKFHLSGPDDVQGLIDNFEGVITTVRQMAYDEGEADGQAAIAKLDQIRQLVADR